MKKFILHISIPLMLAMLACTDYSGEIESAYDEFKETAGNEVKNPCGDAFWCFEQGSASINGGVSWYSYSDASDGGESKFTWQDGSSEANFESLIKAYSTIAGSYQLGPKIKRGNDYILPYLAIGFEFDNVLDATPWGGLCVSYKSTTPLRFMVAFVGEENHNYDRPRYILPETYSASTLDLPWSEFSLGGWSKNPVDINQALTIAQKIEFQFARPDSEENASFELFSVGPLGTCK
jgi:hypothetical protein